MKLKKISKYADIDFPLPERKTKYSAGYDIVVAEDTIVPPFLKLFKTVESQVNTDKEYSLDEIADIIKLTKSKLTLVPTGIKCKLDPDTYLELTMRSSVPLKNWLIMGNSVGKPL